MSDPDLAALAAEPPPAHWRDPATYDQALQQDFMAPLQAAMRQHGHVPRALQLALLARLHWYFTVDARERAPTVVVDDVMAEVLHERMRSVMQHIDPEALEALDPGVVSAEIRHALLSYRAPRLHSAPAVDAYDHDQRLVRLSYWVHGDPPQEQFQIDGRTVTPAYAKYRACNYFRRRLLRQRIVWLDASAGAMLGVTIGGVRQPVRLSPQAFASAPASVSDRVKEVSLDEARAMHPPGKAAWQRPLPSGWSGWKVRLVKALARFPLVRWRYRDAWVFVDRDVDADDSAEHLYRWVREHHPEVKAWYLLRPKSPDWPRLRAEGFRLLAPGLRRRLLALNCLHVVSSHTDQGFGLDPARYGDMMHWRYTFLQHGVIKDDISHWLNPPGFDAFVTSSPAEHQSVIGDDTPYVYTEREVRRTGLPRHDRLLRIAREMPSEMVNLLLVMPTWRGSLVDARMAAQTPSERLAAFAASSYARHWRALLNNTLLRQQAREAGLRLTFVPHVNAEAFVAAFDPPPDVDVVKLSSGMAQQVFARVAAFVTDYTSVAFTFALLRRPVFYYQFDQKEFYGGGHNWRPGYFDYERHGFGPVAQTEVGVLEELGRFLTNGQRIGSNYLERMQQAMPELDGQSCHRTYEAILSLNCRGARRAANPQLA